MIENGVLGKHLFEMQDVHFKKGEPEVSDHMKLNFVCFYKIFEKIFHYYFD